VEAVKDLIQDIDVPRNLSKLKVKIELATEVAEDTKTQGPTKSNPRKLTLQNIIDIYQSACK